VTRTLAPSSRDHDMMEVYSKMSPISDGHGSLVCEISAPKATTLAWPKEAPWEFGGPGELPTRWHGIGAKGGQPKGCDFN
jgi:hypothetical protein